MSWTPDERVRGNGGWWIPVDVTYPGEWEPQPDGQGGYDYPRAARIVEPIVTWRWMPDRRTT